MLNVKYDYSSVHVDVPSPLAGDIIVWGKKHILDEDVYVTNKDPSYGREDEIHVTILYGLHSERPDHVIKLIGQSGTIRAKLGAVGVFTNPYKFDVVMIDIVSPDLCELNNILTKNVNHTNRYGDYHPHITVAYIKKGRGNKYLGLEHWRDKEFYCNYAVFSSKDGTKHKFSF